MIHLKKLPTALNKSLPKSHKFPVSRSKLFGILLKAECTSSPTQLVQFLNEESSREPNINTEDKNKEVHKILSKLPISGKLTEGHTNDFAGSMLSNLTIEDLAKIIEEADTSKLRVATSVIYKLFILKFCFKEQDLSKILGAESLIPQNKLIEVFNTIERNLRILSDESLTKLLAVCASLQISDTSHLMQKLFKLFSSKINSMSSVNVVCIYCILKKHYSICNPQVAALMVACNEIFKNCFESNLHPDIKLKMTHYLSEECLPVNIRECLIKNLIESGSEMSFWSYFRILKGLYLPGVFEGNGSYHMQCIENILRKMLIILEKENYPLFCVHCLLKYYRNGVMVGAISYNETILDSLALNLLKRKPPLLDAITFCRYFFQAGHFNFAFFDYVASKVVNALSSGEFNTMPAHDFYGLIQVLSFAGNEHTKVMSCFYRERLLAACASVCKSYPKFQKTKKVLLPLNLATLGIYEDSLIEYCFTSENGGELTEEDLEGLTNYYLNSLLLLHRTVVTFHPSYQKPLLSEGLLKKLAERSSTTSQTSNNWREVVETCFGGPDFVMKNCTTPLHHKLSYVVVLDKNNVPIDVASVLGTNRETDEPFNITDIPTSEETKVVVIQQVCSQDDYSEPAFKNVSKWKGIFQLEIDVLEVYCDGVVVLVNSDLNSLLGFERVPFLLRKIEKKFGVIGKPMNVKNETTSRR